MFSPFPCFATFSKSMTPGIQLSRQLRCDVRKTDGLDRIHLDLALVHAVASADLDVRADPDRDAQAISPRRTPSRRRFVKTMKLSPIRDPAARRQRTG